jgi:pimeloyl-ACP methyl ester carboxylesterase
VHLVGGSYGATLALHTAVAEPHRLRSLAVFERRNACLSP